MIRPSCQSPSPFSLQDLDMWDTRSHFAAQTSKWCGMAAVSGTGFLSKVSSSTPGSSGGFRQNDPGVKRWQSLSNLASEGSMRSFSPSLGAELGANRGESRQSEVVQWLQDAHERLDTQLDRRRTRDAQHSYHITTAQLLDMKHKHLSEAISTLQQEEITKLSQFEESQQRSKFHEKVQKLEKDLLHMRSTLGRSTTDEPLKRTPGLFSRTLPEKQKVETELSMLREELQSSTETQRTLLNQIQELNQKLGQAAQNHSEVQEQLTEANNKISQACLEKAILSTEVLKLEDNIKNLKAKLTEALSDKHNLIQENGDLHQRNQVLELQLERSYLGSESVELQDNTESHNNKQDKQVNEKLTSEHEMIKQRLEMLQCQLQDLTAERVNSSKLITDLEAENSQLIREKEEQLRKMNEGGKEMEEKCHQLRESVDILQLEKQNLQDHCLCLEAKLLEKDEMLHLQEEEYHKQNTARVQNMEELKAVASHWAEKWQKVALTLQTTQEELEDLKKNNSKNELLVEAGHLETETEKLREKSQKDKEQIDNLLQQKATMEKLLTDNKESYKLLRVELDACKQELELERSRSQMLLSRYKDTGGEAVQTQDQETATDLSESSLLRQPPSDSHSSQNNSPQVCKQNNEVQWLMKRLSEREKELREKTEALSSLERLREMEKCEAHIKISALELKLTKKISEDSHDGEGHANVPTTDSLRAQLEESRRRENQLQQEKIQAVQRLQTLKQLYQIKDDVESRKDKTVCPDQQRRMVTEQLKNLLKEREEKDVRKVDNTAAATAQSEASSVQDWTPTVVRTPGDRWNWQQSSCLMPVFEEDEEEEEPGEEAHADESLHNLKHQVSVMSAEHISLKAETKNLIQALRLQQPIQDLQTTAEKVSHSSDVEVSNPSNCSDECDLKWKPYTLYPDGIFLAEPVDICSPDEDEEEGEHKLDVS